MNKYFALFTFAMAVIALALVGLNIYVLMYPEATGMRGAAVHFVAIGALSGSFILMSVATVAFLTDD